MKKLILVLSLGCGSAFGQTGNPVSNPITYGGPLVSGVYLVPMEVVNSNLVFGTVATSVPAVYPQPMFPNQTVIQPNGTGYSVYSGAYASGLAPQYIVTTLSNGSVIITRNPW